MELLNNAKEILLYAVMGVLAIGLIAALIRTIAGPRFTDRIVGINMIGTQTVLMLCILSYLQKEQYLVDVALIYAMISFLGVVVMVNIYLSVFRERTIRWKKQMELYDAEHEIETTEVGKEKA
ncbi:MAG: monovalent cation/H+ antiporter complex subunit F [Lachnospiraceae bacterium]|nr:monovalent cation/H+ antiporter complex subunit F [Lachnospiraceae bacterium]